MFGRDGRLYARVFKTAEIETRGSMERLDKILAAQGAYSRKDVKAIIKSGRVTVNGKTVKDSSVKIAEHDIVTLDGTVLVLKKHIYLMLNKPEGIVSASDSKSEKTVIDFVPEEFFRSGLFPAGRLDKDTVGFVLITDDGDFAHRILSPKNHVVKTYEARLAKALTEEQKAMIQNGIVLADGTTCKESRVKILENGDNPLVQIQICEGKYHQIKRMFAAAGNKVVYLKRTKMGNLNLDETLLSGECREITPEELLLIESGKFFSDFEQ